MNLMTFGVRHVLTLVAAATAWTAVAAPARAAAMEVLPAGSVRPEGWLLAQLRQQADGLTGHAEELYEDIGKSDWLTGAGVGKQYAWERGPYYAKGLVSLAFVLDDASLKAKARKWVDAILASQRADGDFGPKRRNWWANMIALWLVRDWCEATGDERVESFLSRYFAFQREAFKTYPLAAESPWAVARAGDELDVVLWLYRRTQKAEWLDFARCVSAQSADWDTYYRRGGDPGMASGYRSHIVNFMQGLKTPALQSLIADDKTGSQAYRAAFDPQGWVMRQCGRPDRMVNGSEPLADRSASQGTELCAIAERILSCQTVLAAVGDLSAADDLETVAYNSLPATLGRDGKGLRYYCLLNQPACVDKYLMFANNGGPADSCECNGAICPGPHSGFGCCRSNFHMAWPKFVQSMLMRKDDGLAVLAYGPSRLETVVLGHQVVIVQETDYPFDGKIVLQIVKGEGDFPIFARVPSWCPESDRGAFRAFRRDWKAGDRLELSFPMPVTTSRWAGDAVAVQRGPLLFALQPRHEERAAARYRVPFENRWLEGGDFPRKELLPKSPWNYALLLDKNRGLPQVEVAGKGQDLRLRVKAVRTDFGGWGHLREIAGARAVDPPESPLPDEGGAVETIDLQPMCGAQLRIVLFPWQFAPQSPAWPPVEARALAESQGILVPQMRDGGETKRSYEVYAHGVRPEWGYGAGARTNFFAVVPPKAGHRQGAPLVVLLHSAGCLRPDGKCVRGTGPNHMTSMFRKGDCCVYSIPDDHYAVFPDCGIHFGEDWWWGSQCKKGAGFDLSPCERRVLDEIEWVVQKHGIDRNRIYMAGNSMGGSGTLGIGLRHGDIFAAVKANVPAGVMHALARIGNGRGVPEPPVVVDYSAPNDSWSAGHEKLAAKLSELRYPYHFFWGSFGHCGDNAKVRRYNDLYSGIDWLKIRRNEAYPVFTHASTDDALPWPCDHKKADRLPPGQVNGYFRWTNRVDAADRFEMDLRLVSATEAASRIFTVPTESIADLTLRRVQCFVLKPGEKVAWAFGAAKGTVDADETGHVTIRGLRFTTVSQRLCLTRYIAP